MPNESLREHPNLLILSIDFPAFEKLNAVVTPQGLISQWMNTASMSNPSEFLKYVNLAKALSKSFGLYKSWSEWRLFISGGAFFRPYWHEVAEGFARSFLVFGLVPKPDQDAAFRRFTLPCQDVRGRCDPCVMLH